MSIGAVRNDVLKVNVLFTSLCWFLLLIELFAFLLFYQTDGSVPNTLVIANCEVVKPRVAAAEHISQVTFVVIVFCFFYGVSIRLKLSFPITHYFSV